MRRPSSKIFNTALYLHRVLNCHTFTAREIHDAMPAARKYYHSLIPAHVLAERDRLLVEYHAVDSWDQTYTYRVHGMPEGNYDDLVELNTKLRRLFRGYIVIDEPYYSTNLVADQVCNTYKRGYFLRDDSTRPILYRINPTYLGGN